MERDTSREMNIYDRIEGSWSHHDSMRHWMYESIFEAVKKVDLGTGALKTLEYGSLGTDTPVIRMLKYLRGIDEVHAFVAPEFPSGDVTQKGYPDSSQDVIVLDQVLEHVANPWLAVTNIHEMLRQGGMAVVTTPFMYPLHDCPIDGWRYTPEAYRILFGNWKIIEIGQWGGEQAICWYLNGNMKRFVSVSEGFSSIPGFANPDYSTDYPLVIWGVFQKE